MVGQPIEANDVHLAIRSRPMYFVQLTIDEHTVGDTHNAFLNYPPSSAQQDVAETLISLRHGRRASMTDIVRTVGPRLDLNDYAPYNLPTESSSNI